MSKIEEILKEIRPESNFVESDNFIEDGLLDSFDIIALVSELDASYEISIDGLDIIPENFSNIKSITELVRKSGGHV